MSSELAGVGGRGVLVPEPSCTRNRARQYLVRDANNSSWSVRRERQKFGRICLGPKRREETEATGWRAGPWTRT